MSLEYVKIKIEPDLDVPSSSNNNVNSFGDSEQNSENIKKRLENSNNYDNTEFVNIKVEPDIIDYE